MRTSSNFSSWFHRVLLLVAVCALLAAPGSMAKAADNSQQLPSVQSTGDFLASLSAAPVTGTGTLQAPAPIALSGCTSNDQCPTGQLCCLACGFPDCTAHACFNPFHGHCPFFP